ncbi:metallophosphoesterase [Mariniflexile litorale]|uniref:Metallophosphoesterase n=1 Tax=Mariniflexile litorale TaxID=3045158 RepID=A0AAU7EFQ4_9FLAO|nr:metallophosphoesterase [Mariniflexile sp. KMM 9835]MDQ8209914.1 metallophosphoesterase [Mariniflexile sp. KMM 9835]
MNRRKFIKKGGLTSLGICFLSALYSWKIEPFWLDFVRIKMPIKNLPEDLVGKHIMQISDIHVGNRFDWNYLIDSFKKAQKFNPDIVVYTGDYISYNDRQFEQLKIVMESAVIGKYGTVGVLGNHDYGKKWRQESVANTIIKILDESGIKILRNEQIEIKGLNIIGIDDLWGTNFHPEKALSKLDIRKANLVLCHNPDVCDLNVWKNYNSWILSGHTHGGQVKPPFLPPPILPVKNKTYRAGKINLSKQRTLYINRALGHLWQIRFNVRPEITIFELKRE